VIKPVDALRLQPAYMAAIAAHKDQPKQQFNMPA